MVGTELKERYRIERALGEGGMGRVFEALDLQLHRRVAIKLIREDLDDPQSRDRFLHEARAAATLSHPNACQLYEVSEHEGHPFLVMELLDGEPLSARLKRGPLPKDEAVALIRQLMSVLIEFHQADLIHRDLKPSNVFITDQGPKLLDFGLARQPQRTESLTVSALTVPGAVRGTLRYMAPEQITGDPVDVRTDVFALGVMLYEMLTGRLPFDVPTNLDWLQAVLKEDAPPMRSPELYDLEAVVGRALKRRPEERYASIADMAADLDAALSGDFAPPPSAPEHDGALRLVVLPFRLLQPDQEIGALQDGVPEALTALLASRPELRITSNRQAQEFADSTDLVAVGQTLKVDRLITGSLLKADDEVRVTVQLVDAADGSVQWSKTTQHAVDGILKLQDAICDEIARELPLDAPAAEDKSAG
jgi:eukaryotic-like serine/threonine-protein kinase